MFYNMLAEQIDDVKISKTIKESLKFYFFSRKFFLDFLSNLIVFKILINGQSFWRKDKEYVTSILAHASTITNIFEHKDYIMANLKETDNQRINLWL